MGDTKKVAEMVRELAQLLDETGLTEIEYGHDDWRIRVAKGSAPVAATAPLPVVAAPAAAPASESSDRVPAGAVTAPMVGTAYLAPEPGAKPFIEVGDDVKEGQTLLLIEAMKTFNEIRAPRAGKITEILIESGSPVEYGDALLVLA